MWWGMDGIEPPARTGLGLQPSNRTILFLLALPER